MLTAEGCAARRKRLFEALPSPCDFLIVGDPAHLNYFAGYVASPFEFRTAESSSLLILEPDRATLVADNLLGPFLDQAHVDEVVAPVWYDGSKGTRPRQVQLVESALARLAKVEGKKVGVELSAVPAGVLEGLRAARPGLEVVDISPLIRPMRRSKDADEVETLKLAMRAGEAAQAAALAGIKPGMTELDAYLLVQNAAMTELGERVIVYGDFASGPRTATDKGGPPTSRVIEPGDLLLLDFSVIVDGYRSDFTNTFAVGGKPTPRQVELFEACVGAMRAAEAHLKPGTNAQGVDSAIRDHFRSLGLLELFPHHSGHGIGLGHPEPPYFVPGSDEVLVEGDVVTLEPGLYEEGVGGMRFERNYRITADGFETLSNHEIRIHQ
ncbi:M24 family metallopeptidase [Tundrisphaera lichenicola]|uniref:M24 family metallopeptidase n=1 Tax=Tundrisphaera lichenicola TaxID=2029860 RepID=UPI003EBD5B91